MVSVPSSSSGSVVFDDGDDDDDDANLPATGAGSRSFLCPICEKCLASDNARWQHINMFQDGFFFSHHFEETDVVFAQLVNLLTRVAGQLAAGLRVQVVAIVGFDDCSRTVSLVIQIYSSCLLSPGCD